MEQNEQNQLKDALQAVNQLPKNLQALLFYQLLQKDKIPEEQNIDQQPQQLFSEINADEGQEEKNNQIFQQELLRNQSDFQKAGISYPQAFQKLLSISKVQTSQSQINNNSPQIEQQPKKQHLKYSVQQKRAILLEANSTGNTSSVAKKYNVSETAIRKWRIKIAALQLENEQEIDQNQTEKNNKCKNFNQLPRFPLLEIRLASKMIQERKKNLVITTKFIIDEAVRLRESLEINSLNFKVSNGWIWRFLKRWGFTSRAPTHIMQKLHESSEKQIQEYLLSIQNLRYKYKINEQKSLIWIDLDEIAIYPMHNFRRTYDVKGKKNINVLANGNSKIRFTALCGVAYLDKNLNTNLSQQGNDNNLLNGEQFILPPMIIYKREAKSMVNNFDENVCLVTQNSSGWMTEVLFNIYLESIIVNLNFPADFQIVLIIDKAPCHISLQTQHILKKNKIEYLFIPPGATSILQLMDVACNKQIKDGIISQSNDYLKQQVNVQNPKNITPPSFETQQQWLIKSLDNNINQQTIEKGLMRTGVLLNPINLKDQQYIDENITSPKLIIKTIQKVLKDKEVQEQYDDALELYKSVQNCQELRSYTTDNSLEQQILNLDQETKLKRFGIDDLQMNQQILLLQKQLSLDQESSDQDKQTDQQESENSSDQGDKDYKQKLCSFDDDILFDDQDNEKYTGLIKLVKDDACSDFIEEQLFQSDQISQKKLIKYDKTLQKSQKMTRVQFNQQYRLKDNKIIFNIISTQNNNESQQKDVYKNLGKFFQIKFIQQYVE